MYRGVHDTESELYLIIFGSLFIFFKYNVAHNASVFFRSIIPLYLIFNVILYSIADPVHLQDTTY